MVLRCTVGMVLLVVDAVYIYIHMYIYMYMYNHIYMYMYMYNHIYICTHDHIYIYIDSNPKKDRTVISHDVSLIREEFTFRLLFGVSIVSG